MVEMEVVLAHVDQVDCASARAIQNDQSAMFSRAIVVKD